MTSSQMIIEKADYYRLKKAEEDLIKTKEELNWFKRQIFGQKSEKHISANPEQMDLFGAHPKTETTEKSIPVTAHNRTAKKDHPGREELPAHLERFEEVYDLNDDEKVCSCGEAKQEIGRDKSERLEIIPAKFWVRVLVRPKYACPCCSEKGVSRAFMPSTPINKGKAGASLLTHVILNKYLDHLPLERQSQIFSRLGYGIAKSTLCDWISQICELLSPLYLVLQDKVLESKFINADETTIKVLDKTKKQETHLGYMWGYIGDKKYLVFDYRPSRNKDGPNQFLKEFNGDYIQVDGYDGYNDVFKNTSAKQLGCMAHFRRKFEDAFQNGYVQAEVFLKLISELYDVERDIKDLTADEKCQIRQSLSKVILVKIKSELDSLLNTEVPKAGLSKALIYGKNQWPHLIRYIEDGDLSIDNNIIERHIRPIALGRKNYLFAGSHEGAKRAAILYSLIGTCKIHGVNPKEYFEFILTYINDWNQQKLEQMLPDHLIECGKLNVNL